ncbi:hypothetical protein [Streptomyces sp. C]|uniref:hypothetical protein n=1 Tax=Streptomyces sp. C TaxID=253839 RepID=UPI0001DEEC82|nr:hypothetical protein [Streptomyces sp. C]EFL14812.1 predicted protein [Streptomyces sp. C]
MTESPPRAPMRGTRAAMFAAVCVALGAVGHSYMSGMNVPLGSLVAAFAVTGALAWVAAGRRCGPAGITVALLAVQGVLHLAFSAGQAAGHGHTAPAPAEPMPGHHHVPGTRTAAPTGTAAAADGAAGAGDMAGGTVDGMGGTADGMGDMADGLGGMGGVMADMAGMAGHGGLGMIAAHVLAGVFCAAWLARGEAAVFRLARVLGATALLAARPLARVLALLPTRRPAPEPEPPAHRPAHERPRRLRGAVHAHTAVRRGPPGWRDTHSTAPRPCRQSPARPTAPTAYAHRVAAGRRCAPSRAHAPAGAAPAAPVPHPARA